MGFGFAGEMLGIIRWIEGNDEKSGRIVQNRNLEVKGVAKDSLKSPRIGNGQTSSNGLVLILPQELVQSLDDHAGDRISCFLGIRIDPFSQPTRDLNIQFLRRVSTLVGNGIFFHPMGYPFW